ncbi:MAG: hypothetical protein COY40_04020 [Alphaproteobacteria bacterium CG_4_10_14_0_8_um_filter_53_9]|nr:MAG: hypothetical protein COY40_04020 [Alphaproteobacteria bacterium CG_4_10_14_0_8_um_filter_53_9]
MSKQPQTALHYAIDLLSRREHSLSELQTKLKAKGYSPENIAECLERLKEKNLQNNARYAVARARYRAQISRWGWAKIRQELTAKGVSEEDITAAKAGLEEADITFEEEATRQASKLKSKPYEKAFAALLRRGYTPDQAKSALQTAREEENK